MYQILCAVLSIWKRRRHNNVNVTISFIGYRKKKISFTEIITWYLFNIITYLINNDISIHRIWRIFVEIIFRFGRGIDYYFGLPKEKKRCLEEDVFRILGDVSFLRCTYTTFTAKKNDFSRTEPGVWGARVTVVYFRFRDNFECFCHTSIITNFDIFNLEPTLFVAPLGYLPRIQPRRVRCSDFACDACAQLKHNNNIINNNNNNNILIGYRGKLICLLWFRVA